MQSNARASKKQQELLSFVDGFIKGNGYGPSYREIMRALGYKSVSTVATHIDGLIAKGYLARRDNSARSLEVVTMRTNEAPPAKDAPLDIEQQLIKDIASLEITDTEQRIVHQAMQILGYKKAAEAADTANDEVVESVK